jgi:soluble lytic murein transglycosylase-like protein
MSRIVFASNLRKTVNVGRARKASFYARPHIWAPLLAFNCALVFGFFIPGSVAPMAPPLASPPPVASIELEGAAVAAAMAQARSLEEAPARIDPKARKAARYIAKNFQIAHEAAELIAEEAFKMGKANRVDPLLLLAIIGVESRFNPIAGSSAGAKGMTQVMPKAHPEKIATLEKTHGHILNIGDNIDVGAKVMGEYLRKFDNNSVLALQQYNGSLDDENRAYSAKVLLLLAKLKAASA